MSYELTDEDIDNAWPNEPLHIIKNGEALWLELLRVAHVIAKAAQEKQRNYYRDMTPEKLRKKVKDLLDTDMHRVAINRNWWEQSEQSADQILSLVIPHTIEKLLEKIEGMENPYPVYSTDGKTWNPYGYDKMNTWNEAIQAVLKVIKEVEQVIYKQSVIEVKIRLDPLPGWGHEPEDHVRMLESQLMDIIPHYKPKVRLLRVEQEVQNGQD